MLRGCRGIACHPIITLQHITFKDGMTNEYGLDVAYFQKKLKQILSVIHYYTPEELARELTRIALTANDCVAAEEMLHYHDK